MILSFVYLTFTYNFHYNILIIFHRREGFCAAMIPDFTVSAFRDSCFKKKASQNLRILTRFFVPVKAFRFPALSAVSALRPNRDFFYFTSFFILEVKTTMEST